MSIEVWVEVALAVIVIILLGYIISLRRSLPRQRKLQTELDAQREELKMLRAGKVKARSIVVDEAVPESGENLFQLVRDLESLREAIAGSKVSQRMLMKRYGLEPGRKLFEQILKAPRLDFRLKNRMADEIIVGESGRTIMKRLDSGASVEEAANAAGMPLAVAKTQVTRLRTLEYLDPRLRVTKRGRRALI